MSTDLITSRQLAERQCTVSLPKNTETTIYNSYKISTKIRDDKVGSIVELGAVVEKIFTVYLGATLDELNGERMSEVVDIILEQYAQLAVSEVELAFKLAMSNKIDVTGVDMKMYNGQVRAITVCEVLNRYIEYRKGVVVEKERINPPDPQRGLLPSGEENLSVRLLRAYCTHGNMDTVNSHHYELIEKYLDYKFEYWVKQYAWEWAKHKVVGELIVEAQKVYNDYARMAALAKAQNEDARRLRRIVISQTELAKCWFRIRHEENDFDSFLKAK